MDFPEDHITSNRAAAYLLKDSEIFKESALKSRVSQVPKIRVGFFDDDPLMLIGFRALLGAEPDLEITITSNLEEANTADVAILRGKRGYGVSPNARKLVLANAGIRVLATESGLYEGDIVEAIATGAKGYISETASATEFAKAIRTVTQEAIWAPRHLLSMVTQRVANHLPGVHFSHQPALKGRQRQVLELLVAGSSNKEIAAPLGIEERTVKAHISHLMRKLGAKNRIEVPVQAIRRSIVSV
jgi:DNA-binding NarL/FixJ family response regulator